MQALTSGVPQLVASPEPVVPACGSEYVGARNGRMERLGLVHAIVIGTFGRWTENEPQERHAVTAWARKWLYTPEDQRTWRDKDELCYEDRQTSRPG